ncbi:hypothetical protein D3C81_1722450 [compost metagenome]
MRSTNWLKAPPSSPNSSLLSTARRRVRSPSPWAMSCMARPMVVSGRISTWINRLSSTAMAVTATNMAIKAEVRNLPRAA